MSFHIGLDGNQPIDKNGKIQAQVANPSIIADTGTGWVRINFVLGPWKSPDDTTKRGPNEQTWQQTYHQIVDGFQSKKVKVYGLISAGAVFTTLKNQLRHAPQGPWPPSGLPTNSWIDEYVENFAKIVGMFPHVEMFESFNEPDDWHKEKCNWIHPEWFAVILQRLYHEVPRAPHIKLISGSVQGLAHNHNGGVGYLKTVYQTGQARLHWGTTGHPFPFDGVGYHIYVAQPFKTTQAAQVKQVQKDYRSYLNQMLSILKQHDLRAKQLYISEMGWYTNPDKSGLDQHKREELQATSIQAAFDFLQSNRNITPHIADVSLFCTQDFGAHSDNKYYGLYRISGLTVNDRKPAYYIFKSICERSSDPVF